MTDEIIIESIKKMLLLKMSDEDIIASLVDAGVDYDYAKSMLYSVKNNKALPKEKPLKNDNNKELFDKAISASTNKPNSNTDNSLKDVDKTSLGVWQEGVITIITQKLNEIEAKEKALDEEIKTRVNNITNSELTKMKAIINSQRTLLISKVDMEVASNLKDVKEQTSNTLKLIQDVNANTQKKLDEIKSLTESLNDMKKTLQDNLDQVQNIKESLNSAIMNFKSKSATELDELFTQYKAQIDDITNKTNATLNLAGKILESLVNASKAKIDGYCETKLNNFMTELKSKLNIDDIKLALDKLNTIKDLDVKISNSVDKKVAFAISNLSSKNKNKDVNDSIIDLNRRLMDLEKAYHNKSDIDLEELNSRIDELDMYRKQSSNLIAKLMKEKEPDLAKLKQKVNVENEKQKKSKK